MWPSVSRPHRVATAIPGTLKERMSYDLEPIELFTSTAGRPSWWSVALLSDEYELKECPSFVRLYDGDTKKVLKDIQLPDLKEASM